MILIVKSDDCSFIIEAPPPNESCNTVKTGSHVPRSTILSSLPECVPVESASFVLAVGSKRRISWNALARNEENTSLNYSFPAEIDPGIFAFSLRLNVYRLLSNVKCVIGTAMATADPCWHSLSTNASLGKYQRAYFGQNFRIQTYHMLSLLFPRHTILKRADS